MTDYPFDMQLVVDPFSTSNVVANGQIYIYSPDDTSNSTPLNLTDPNGLPLTNPLMSNSNGFLPPFMTTLPQVKWVGAGFVGFFDSYHGLRNEAMDAKAAAQDAAASALTAAGTALAAVNEALSDAIASAEASQAAAIAAASDAEAAVVAAEQAAAAALGGGFAVDPTNSNVLLISTKDDGTVAVDPTNPNVLLITI